MSESTRRGLLFSLLGWSSLLGVYAYIFYFCTGTMPNGFVLGCLVLLTDIYFWTRVKRN